MRVFLSHSSRDHALVEQITKHFPPWLETWIDDERLLFGSELAPSLRDAIDADTDYVVLLFSQTAAESAWVKQEISWALARERELGRTFLLPVLLDDVRPRLSDHGLAGRVTLDIGDHRNGSAELLADRLTNHLGGWMASRLATVSSPPRHLAPSDPLARLGDQVLSLIHDVPHPWRSSVATILVEPFIHDLAATRGGAIRLTPGQYYTRILSEMRRVGTTARVMAVSTLSSELWSHDVDQTRYAARNLEAVARGARIQRIFILPETRALRYVDAIRDQREAGIEVKVANTSLLAHVADLEDFVLFQTPDGTRAYVAQASIDGSRRVRSGTLLVAAHALTRVRNAFDDAWELAATAEQFFASRHSSSQRLPPPAAPGTRLRADRLDRAVVTCQEAAIARNIPLAQELKTLILKTSNGLVAAHVPGDAALSLRKVKLRLETAQAYLADPADLRGLGLSPGTVSAVLEPVWSMAHLVSRRLLTMNQVATNDGTLTGYFKFSPAVLTEAANVIVDEFER